MIYKLGLWVFDYTSKQTRTSSSKLVSLLCKRSAKAEDNSVSSGNPVRNGHTRLFFPNFPGCRQTRTSSSKLVSLPCKRSAKAQDNSVSSGNLVRNGHTRLFS
ncbi:hypothetical protein CDAR_281451 [Caerostris darwini]|uniref:Uncharacterized protein n=1 Tax=Caerostris darwini TaxID=1538125 RepID=A0AAV4VMY5_9ARAC|nr:hypothetical protein CDAR_281451 [Caerostris darwini]